MIQLEIWGRPVPSNGPKEGRGHFYNPKSKEMDMARWQLKAQFNQPIIKGPVHTRAIYFFKIPKGTSSIKRKQMLANIIKHTSKPDRGNLDKFLEDVLQGIVIDNDSKIWDSHHTKRWCDTEKDEKTVIYVYPD